jgi:hypothetical protein
LKAELPVLPVVKIKADGEYGIAENKLVAKIYLEDISPQDFAAYYRDSGLTFTKGLIDGSADVSGESGVISCQLSLRSKNISLSKDKMSAELGANLSAGIKLDLESKKPNYTGILEFKGARVKLEALPESFEEISGKLEFLPDQLKWEGLNFQYLKVPYKTSGTLTNFISPGVQLEISSPDISLQSNFAYAGNRLNLLSLKGRYHNSDFSIGGAIVMADKEGPQAELVGEGLVDLKDLGGLLPKFKAQIESAKPKGALKLQVKANGNISDFRKLTVEAQASGGNISAYGLRAEDFSFNYNQAEGIAEVPLLHMALYGGILEANARLNLNSDNFPYLITVNAQGLKLEQLKADTAVKDQDISGTLAAQVKVNGFKDLEKINGAGNILVSEGKLWQLNLFKGLGSLLFTKDFSSIVFQEASCDFLIQDKYIATENLKMLSNVADLEGKARVGFDSSLDISLNVKVLDENAPLTGTFKDVTTAVIGQAGKFGVIRITGTLKEPKYKFQTAVVDIIKGLKNAIFGQ